MQLPASHLVLADIELTWSHGVSCKLLLPH